MRWRHYDVLVDVKLFSPMCLEPTLELAARTFPHSFQKKRCFYCCLRAQTITKDSALYSNITFLSAGISSVSDVENRCAAQRELLSF